MFDPLQTVMKISASGLDAQSLRMRVVSENLANAQSTGVAPGSDPYTRKTISFATELDHVSGGSMVSVEQIGLHKAPYRIEHDPGHPAADDKGFVKLPNVNVMVEMADMSEARRTYEANLQVIKQARSMISMTIGMLQAR